MATVLSSISEAMADAVEAAGSQVVRVEGRRRLPASGIVWSPDGVIVTAHHVVERDDDIHVGLPAGETVSATLVGRDPSTDLAVLRTEANGLEPTPWAEADSIPVGHLALALGRPGQGVMATFGIVSAVGEGWRTPSGGRLDRFVKPDLVMYPGFSGGPLIDAMGRFQGLNTSALTRGTALTVSVPTLRQVVETLLTHGRVRRAYLGIGSQPTRIPELVSKKLNQETGLLLVSVEPGSPAEKGGLYLGDTVLGMNGHSVRSLDDLFGMLTDDRVGQEVKVRILRAGEVLEVSIVLGERS